MYNFKMSRRDSREAVRDYRRKKRETKWWFVAAVILIGIPFLLAARYYKTISILLAYGAQALVIHSSHFV